MRILLVSDYGTPSGGAEIQLLALRDDLRRRGHDARYFSSSARASHEPAGTADYECFGTVSSFRTLLQTANPFAYRRLRQVLAEFRPDVVHVMLFLTQLSPLILPLLRRVPSIYHVAWYRPVCPLGTRMLPDGSACRVRAGTPCYSNGCLPLRDWIPLTVQMKLWRRWQGAFRMILANSAATRQVLEADGIPVSAVVWHGTPVHDARVALAPRPTVVYAGRLVPEKGVDVLLRAFAIVARELPGATLLIAGEGPARDALECLTTELGLAGRVTITGHLSHAELERRSEAAWVQAVPSRWAEPFGVVAIEALMRGRAVIASASGGLAEIVRDGETGFLVPPGEVQPLADALLRVLRERSVAERMGAAARRDALLRFRDTDVTDRWLALYAQLMTTEVATDDAA